MVIYGVQKKRFWTHIVTYSQYGDASKHYTHKVVTVGSTVSNTKDYNHFLVDRLLMAKRFLMEILRIYGQGQTSGAGLVEVRPSVIQWGL